MAQTEWWTVKEKNMLEKLPQDFLMQAPYFHITTSTTQIKDIIPVLVIDEQNNWQTESFSNLHLHIFEICHQTHMIECDSNIFLGFL